MGTFLRCLVLLSAVPAAVVAQALPDGVTRLSSVEGITEYRLENGLEVLLFPDPSAATITVNVTYLVGSVDEGYGETGMAHLLEHMLFRGTPSHPDPLKELQDMGANMNGSTAWERTNYFETFEASDENLAWALEFEADRMINANIAQEDLDNEMTVVRNEFESSENDPIGVLLYRVLSTAYIWHGYGNPPIGSRADIENVPIERLQAFYRTHYQPDNAVLIVAGQIDESRTLELIAENFGPISRPERQLTDNYTVEPVQDGERIVTLSRVGDVQAVMAGFHTSDGNHEDFVPLQVAARVLADTPSGRLYRALVETGLAANVLVQELQLKDPGIMIFAAIVGPDGDVDEVRRIMLETIAAVAEEPITDEEVERIRNQALADVERVMNNSQSMALQLSEWAAMGDWRMFFLDRDRVRETTAEEVQAAALHYFKPSNRTVGIFKPETDPNRTTIPEKPDIAALLEGYTGDEMRSLGEAFDPSPDNIDARTLVRSLPGGIELAMLPKETRGDQVNVTVQLHFGNLESLTGKDTEASLMAAMLMRGTRSRSRQEIQDELDRLQSRLGIGGGAGSVNASIQSTRENLPAVLELAFEVLREPAFPEDELRTLVDGNLVAIEAQRSEPDAIASLALARHLGQNYEPGDPRYTPTIDESIEALKSVDVDDLRRFHQEFVGVADTHVAVVGDFDPEAFEAAIREGLDDWRSPVPYEQITTPYPDPVPPPLNQSFDTPDKENAYFLAALPVRMSAEHEDYPALVLGTYILGSGPGSRLFARIRVDEGLSYGVSAGFQAPIASDGGRFSAQAIAAPQNIAQVEASFLDEVATILREGYSDDEIAAAKNSWSQARQVSRSRDGSLTSMLVSNLHYDRTMANDSELESKVLALTGDEIRDAMRRHIDLAAMTIMKGGDFDR